MARRSGGILRNGRVAGGTGTGTVPDASETVAGKIEIATQGEATAGTDASKAIVPSTLKGVTDAIASGAGFDVGDNVPSTDPVDGFHYVYSVAQSSLTTGKTFETAAGTAITAAAAYDIFEWDDSNNKWILRANLPIASNTAVGAIQLATSTEATGGTDSLKAITAATLATVLTARGAGFDAGDNVPSTNPADGFLYLYTVAQSSLTSGKTFESAAGSTISSANAYDLFEWDNTNTKWIRRGLLPAATATLRGIAELATEAEATAGTDANRVITPATLRAVARQTEVAAKVRKLEWAGGFNGTINSPQSPKLLNVQIAASYTTWAASTSYALNAYVQNSADGTFYRCNASHTSSSTFAADSSRWDVVAGYHEITGGEQLIRFGTNNDNARISFQNSAVDPAAMVFEMGLKVVANRNWGFWIGLGTNNPSVSGNEGGVDRGLLMFILTNQAAGTFRIDIKRGNSSTSNMGSGELEFFEEAYLAPGATNDDTFRLPNVTSGIQGAAAGYANLDVADTSKAYKGLAVHEDSNRFYLLEKGDVTAYDLRTGVEVQHGSFSVFPGTEAWSTGTSYVAATIVLQDDKYYRCNTAHTASAAFATDSANWDEIVAVDIAANDTYVFVLFDVAGGTSLDFIGKFYRNLGKYAGSANTISVTNQNGSNSVLKGLDIFGTRAYVLERHAAANTSRQSVRTYRLDVTTGNYQSSESFSAELLTGSAWAAATVYALNDIVLQGGEYYRCTTAHTASAAFATDSANWAIELAKSVGICRSNNNIIYLSQPLGTVPEEFNAFSLTGSRITTGAGRDFSGDDDNDSAASMARSRSKLYALDTSLKRIFAYQQSTTRQIKFVVYQKQLQIWYDGVHYATYTYTDAAFPLRRNSTGAYVSAPGPHFILQSNANASGFQIDISNLVVRDLTTEELNLDWGHGH